MHSGLQQDKHIWRLITTGIIDIMCGVPDAMRGPHDVGQAE